MIKQFLQLSTGALVPSIKTQLEDQGLQVKPSEAMHFQRIADNITFLSVHGILTPAASAAARRRMVKKLARSCFPANGGGKP